MTATKRRGPMRTTGLMAALAAAACLAAAPACGDGDSSPPASASSSSSSSGGGGSEDSGAASSDGASAGGLPNDCSGEPTTVPTEPGALNAWLQTREYACWARESGVHASAGPHGGNVRTYLSEALDQSLAGSGEHPAGSVSVKEFYGQGTETVTGWAVGVKTQPASDGGQGWYWYEVFSTEPGASAAFEGQGLALCSNCHAGGDDYVLSPHPLQ
jgi:hypothetical protein